MNATEIKQDAAVVKARFVDEWGVYRRFIAKHPLTGSFIALAAGIALGFFVAPIV